MTLLDPPPLKEEKSRAIPFTIAVVLIALVIVLWFTFRYYPEKKAVTQFFDALVADDTAKAYAIWKPAPTYTMSRFLSDWGSDGYYGPIKSFKIVSSKQPRNSGSVAVNVAISPYAPMPEESDAEKSRKTRVVTIWVLPDDKSLSFPP